MTKTNYRDLLTNCSYVDYTETDNTVQIEHKRAGFKSEDSEVFKIFNGNGTFLIVDLKKGNKQIKEQVSGVEITITYEESDKIIILNFN